MLSSRSRAPGAVVAGLLGQLAVALTMVYGRVVDLLARGSLFVGLESTRGELLQVEQHLSQARRLLEAAAAEVGGHGAAGVALSGERRGRADDLHRD